MAFVIGVALGEALHDNPQPGGTQTRHSDFEAVTQFNFAATLGSFLVAVAYRDLPGRRAPTTEPDWLTLGQAAKYLGVAQSTIRKWSDQGRVPAFYTPGGHRRYRRADLDKFLESSGPGAREQAGPTVLVVDDDDRMREYMRASLELEGYSVLEAGTAEEGLAVLEGEQRHSLILLDVMMPGMDGWEMLQRIQERHGSIPVIMFSGQVDERSARDAEERGASAFVGKPFDPQQLIDQAKQILPLSCPSPASLSARGSRLRRSHWLAARGTLLRLRSVTARLSRACSNVIGWISGSSGGWCTTAPSRSTRSSSRCRTSAASASSGSRSP